MDCTPCHAAECRLCCGNAQRAYCGAAALLQPAKAMRMYTMHLSSNAGLACCAARLSCPNAACLQHYDRLACAVSLLSAELCNKSGVVRCWMSREQCCSFACAGKANSPAIGMLMGVTFKRYVLSAGVALTSFGQIVSNAEACNSSAYNDCICCGVLLKRWVGRPLQEQWACCLYNHVESPQMAQDCLPHVSRTERISQ